MRIAFLFVLIWGSVSNAQKTIEEKQTSEIKFHNQNLKKPELYLCKDSKIKTNFIENVPSYPFYETVNFSIHKDPFPGCKSGRRPSKEKLTSLLETLESYGMQGYASFVLNKKTWKELKFDPGFSDLVFYDIETSGVSISPHGFLNIEDHNYDSDEFCIRNYAREQINGTLYNHTLLEISVCPYDCQWDSHTDSCIPKCCPLGQSLNYGGGGATCDFSGEKVWKGFFYDTNGKRVEKSDKKFHYSRKIINCDMRPPPQKNASVENWFNRKFTLMNITRHKTLFRLSENGELSFLGASRKYEQLPNGAGFCIDGVQVETNGYSGKEEDQAVFVCSDYQEKCYPEGEEWKQSTMSTMYMGCLFGAAFFYLATTAVYLLLWDSQKVHGWTVVSLTISLCLMCTSTATMHLFSLYGGSDLRLSIRCKVNAIFAHYFYISSFTWLCIVNYDIWSTFRALQRRNDKDLMKFVWYSLVGWGIPFLFICISITLNECYPERESMVLIPEYGDNLCFVTNWAQGAYIYYPLLLPIVIILSLTGSTFWNLYGFQRESSMARSSSSNSDRQLAKLYMKLSLILGTSWSFEVISWLASSENCQHWIWVVADLYNALSAILIFLFFGLKESNVLLLEEKYEIFKDLGLSQLYRKASRAVSSAGTKSTGISSKDKESSSTSAVIDETNMVHKKSSQGYGSTGSKISNK